MIIKHNQSVSEYRIKRLKKDTLVPPSELFGVAKEWGVSYEMVQDILRDIRKDRLLNEDYT